MPWGLFAPQYPRDHVMALRAFSTGLTALGVEHFYTGLEYKKCEVAVLFGVGKKAVPASWARGKIIALQDEAEGRLMIIEKGFVKRDEYFHIGWDGLNGRAEFNNSGMPPDRWNKLGIDLVPWQDDQPERPIIVCGQVPWDASVQHTDHILWCRETMALLRSITARPLIFRPHPATNNQVDYAVPGVSVSTKRFEDDLANAHAVVTFNSNCAVEAAIKGVPVFVADQGSMAREIANYELSDIEHPNKPPRNQWANDLAYTQWNLAEITCGDPITHLIGKKSHGKTEPRVS